MIRRLLFWLSFALMALPAPAIAQSFAMPPLRLAFEDNFTDTLDLRVGESGVWSTTFGYRGVANRTLTSNRELQLYVEPGFRGTSRRSLGFAPFAIADGVLRISADRVPRQTARRMWGYRYSSGMINTRESFAQTYGYFEMRARLPEGRGLWPAFWLLPASGGWPPEIDVLEQLGRDPTTIYVALKTGAGPNTDVQPIEVKTATTAFHTYGVLWLRENVTWYIDNVPVRTLPTPDDMHVPMYMIVNLAVGGPWARAPNAETPFPATLEVDYVRAYALAGE
jgi:beta-glucanase (GH16 family)